MRTKIVTRGGSKTVRIPQVIWEQSKLADDVDLVAIPGRVVIRSAKGPRQDWDKAFKRMAAEQDDAPLDGEPSGLSSWDQTEWQW
jgi:antitoxin MazE